MALYSVLIVDDEEEFREMTSKRLIKRDLECECAPDGDTALEMIAKKTTTSFCSTSKCQAATASKPFARSRR